MSEFEYDPERSLWRPGRRSFLFMFGAAVVGAMMPELSGKGPWNVGSLTEESHADFLVETLSRLAFRTSMDIEGDILERLRVQPDERMPRDTIVFMDEPRLQGVAPVLRGVITDLKEPG